MKRLALPVLALVVAAGALSQTSPAFSDRAPSSEPLDYREDVTLDQYLFALQQISPAARDGTQAYVDAYAKRCGRALSVVSLRRMVAEGQGDPLLMGMIRAAHLRDDATLRRLTASVTCRR